jgi:hypothetical protein
MRSSRHSEMRYAGWSNDCIVLDAALTFCAELIELVDWARRKAMCWDLVIADAVTFSEQWKQRNCVPFIPWSYERCHAFVSRAGHPIGRAGSEM